MFTLVIEQKNRIGLWCFGRRIGGVLVKTECYKYQDEVTGTQRVRGSIDPPTPGHLQGSRPREGEFE